MGAWFRAEVVYPSKTVTHLGTNRAWRRVTAFISRNVLLLYTKPANEAADDCAYNCPFTVNNIYITEIQSNRLRLLQRTKVNQLSRKQVATADVHIVHCFQ